MFDKDQLTCDYCDETQHSRESCWKSNEITPHDQQVRLSKTIKTPISRVVSNTGSFSNEVVYIYFLKGLLLQLGSH